MNKLEHACATWIFELFAIVVMACGACMVCFVAYLILGQNF